MHPTDNVEVVCGCEGRRGVVLAMNLRKDTVRCPWCNGQYESRYRVVDGDTGAHHAFAGSLADAKKIAHRDVRESHGNGLAIYDKAEKRVVYDTLTGAL